MSFMSLDPKELREKWMKLYLNLNMLLSTDPHKAEELKKFKFHLAEMNEKFMPFFDMLEDVKEAET